MSSRPAQAFVLAGALVASLSPGVATAGNGHLLHGVGPINSSLGGAGTGFAMDAMTAMYANPALMTRLDPISVVLTTEIFLDDLSATTQRASGAAHSTPSDGEPGVLPSFAASYRPGGGRFAIGTALLAVAGFRTNWPTDPDSLLLAPQPDGFGDLHTELGVAKIPVAMAFQATDKLSLGLSLNAYQSRLIINPLPVVRPNCVGEFGSGDCYRPATKIPVSGYAFGVQLGAYYEASDMVSFGASWVSAQNYDPFEWSTTHANPQIVSGPEAFGTRRDVAIDLDQPQHFTFGVGLRPNDKWLIGLETKWVGYADTNGIGGTGGISSDGELISIGWRDIWIGMAGIQFSPNDKLALRAGLNFNQSPIREEVALNSGGTPSVFEQHYTVGATVRVTPNFQLDLGGYYTPENSISGPFTGVEGATVTYTNSIISGLFGFSFKF